MRIIAGIARGRRLKSGAGRSTRPTSDRVRQVLFDILAPRLAGATFLDLYAGFGSVGLEALSRGAGRVVFVEGRRKCCDLIAENLRLLALPGRGEVICREVGKALARLHRAGETFCLIFADPPYRTGQAAACLGWLGEQASLLAAGGLVIIQHHVWEELAECQGSLARSRQRRVGDTQLSFYRVHEEAW